MYYVSVNEAHEVHAEAMSGSFENHPVHVQEGTSRSTRLKRFWCVETSAESHVILVRRRVDENDKDAYQEQDGIQNPFTKQGEGKIKPIRWMMAYVGSRKDNAIDTST